MYAKLALILLLISATASAGEPRQVIAMSPEDAETCQSGCSMITEAAKKVLATRIAQLEAIVARQAAELAKKPNPKFCL